MKIHTVLALLVLIYVQSCDNSQIPNDSNKNKLSLASEVQDLNGIQKELDAKVDINSVDDLGRTALMLAARAGKYESVNFLLQKGADISLTDLNNIDFLSYCVLGGNIDLVKLAIDKGFDIKKESDVGVTPILLAATLPKPDLLKFFIDNGISLDSTDNERDDAMQYACMYNSVENIRFLKEKGKDINAITDKGMSPLFRTIVEEKPEAFTTLLDLGADPNLVHHTFNQSTPLIGAVSVNSLAMVKELVKRGANVNYKTSYEVTPFLVAAGQSSKDILDFLLANGANLTDIYPADGSNALMIAAQQNMNIDSIRLLIQKTADLTIKNKDGKTALDLLKERTDIATSELIEEVNKKIGVK